jgi:aspartate/methionine/tyrosine aminotransferase
MVSVVLTGFSMRPEVRESIFGRTRGIIRENLPSLEEWIGGRGDLLTYVRPVAGAIAYLKYRLPIRSARLAERIRTEQSVLIVPGAMFGLGKGFRVGFGFDMEQTRKALDRVATVLADVARGA